MEGEVRYFIAILLVGLGLTLVRRWWGTRRERKDNGILPMSAAAMWIDEKGQPASIPQVLRAFSEGLPLLFGIVLIVFGFVILFAGETQ